VKVALPLLLAAVAAAAGFLLFRPDEMLADRKTESFVASYCVDCHNRIDETGGLSLEGHELATLETDRDIWERVVRKLRIGMMPPADAPSPATEEREAIVHALEARLDSTGDPLAEPGPALVRRLNRAEYSNAIRDLLDLGIDGTSLLPPDDSAYGFDNNAEALVTSPLLIPIRAPPRRSSASARTARRTFRRPACPSARSAAASSTSCCRWTASTGSTCAITSRTSAR
jgi:hypothetical protein